MTYQITFDTITITAIASNIQDLFDLLCEEGYNYEMIDDKIFYN
jgi:hypothetical protein